MLQECPLTIGNNYQYHELGRMTGVYLTAKKLIFSDLDKNNNNIYIYMYIFYTIDLHKDNNNTKSYSSFFNINGTHF